MTVPDPPALVDILIVSYDTRELLRECLTSIERHRPPAAAVMLQVSVFDNASSDGSADMVTTCFPQARLVRSETNVGFGRANNLLASTSTADYLMLLNSDTAFISDVVTPLLATLTRDPRVALVAPRLEYPDGLPQYSSERFPTLRFEIANALYGTKLWFALRRPFALDRILAQTRRTDDIARLRVHDADFVWATCWLLRSMDVAGGLFDERFFIYDEDLDYCRRVRARGRRIVWLGSTSVVHHGGSSSQTPAKERLAQAGRRLYYQRHEGAVTAATYTGVVRAVAATKALTRLARSHQRGRPGAQPS